MTASLTSSPVPKPDHYEFRLALSAADLAGYFELRRRIFCQEQHIFDQDDRDAIDNHAYPIVAVARWTETGDRHMANHEKMADRVVGVVRIYEEKPRLWYGGRLGVDSEFRRVGRIGQGLIHTAVTTANAWGCDRFLATVQRQNVRFFRRLHWSSLEEIQVCDRPHHLMEADLNYYPPARDRPRPSHPLPA
jgi:putative N-acetyltransferase (TIGR04045 family)